MDNDKIETFLNELTALSHKHGLGIDGAELYELESEDSERRYTCGNNSLLDFE